ncbi:MAG: Maf family protein [Chloroflexia bacterium]
MPRPRASRVCAMAVLRVVLASNSPRRQEYLAWLGVPFEVRVVPVDEAAQEGESPEAMGERLARAKAEAVPCAPDEIVLAADTLVVLGHEVLGKPADADEALRMLLALRGRQHEVLTAVAFRTRSELEVQVVKARVWMRSYTPAEVEAYIASGQPFDKAGAYGIQDEPFSPVSRVEGCGLTVVGFPLCHIAQGLLRRGIPVPRQPVDLCRLSFDIRQCPVALFG